MNDAKTESVKTTLRMICLAVLGFVFEAVIEKLAKIDLPLKEILIPLLIYIDKFIYEKRKIYEIRGKDVPFWLNLKMPF